MPRVYYVVLALFLAGCIGFGLGQCSQPSPCHQNSIGEWCSYQR